MLSEIYDYDAARKLFLFHALQIQIDRRSRQKTAQNPILGFLQ